MRFESSLILFALGALASAKDSKPRPQMSHRPNHFPVMQEVVVDHEVCSRAVDRLLYDNINPNTALNEAASSGQPFYDSSFAFPEAFFWEDMGMALSAGDSQSGMVGQTDIKRITEVYDSSYSMWGSNGIELIDPNQGYIGDCWIVAAASCVAQTPERIRKLFVTDDLNNAGVYTVTLYLMGIPVTVTVDDYLPFWAGSNNLTYASASSDGALWMPILEKAAAKLYGNYEMLSGGMMGPAIQTLTGSPFFDAWHEEMSVDELWDWINVKMEEEWMITGGSPYGEGTDQEENRIGVAYMHAFTMLGAETLSNGQRLLRMRNPWGSETFKGPFADWRVDAEDNVTESDSWTAALKEELEYVQANDGMWYIKIEDYHWSFDQTTANPNIDDWHASHYAAFDVPTEWEAHKEVITISSDVDQMVYISAYTYDSQHIRNGLCYDEEAMRDQELYMTHDRADKWYSLVYENYAHAEGVLMKAGESFNIQFMAYWSEDDHTPHDYSIVAQAEKAPVSLIATHDHGQKDFENFTINEGTQIYPLDFDLIDPATHKTCEGSSNSCTHDYQYNEEGDRFIVNMSLVSENTMHFSMSAEGISTEFEFVYNDDNDITVTWLCAGGDSMIHSKQGLDDYGRWERCTADPEKKYWTGFMTNIQGNRQSWSPGVVFQAVWQAYDEIATYNIVWNTSEMTVTTQWHAEGWDSKSFGGEVWDWSSASPLSLKEKTTAAAEPENKRISTGVYAGVSVAAASLFACVFMAKRKSVSDDFERA